MLPNPSTSVIVPVTDHPEAIASCLTALGQAGPRDIELVLVDLTAAGGWQPPRGLRDRVRMVRGGPHWHRARAWNAGAQVALGDVLVVMDADTVVRPGWHAPLLDAVSDAGVGAAGALVLSPDGRVAHAGLALTPGGELAELYRGLPGDHPVVTRSRDLAMVSGACLAIRREVLAAVSGFDEEFMGSHDDVDLCQRLLRDGHRVRHCGESVVVRHAGRSVDPGENDTANRTRFREIWRHVRPDLEERLAEDGIPAVDGALGVTVCECMWIGPLFDGTPEAALGLRAVVALERAGMVPGVTEIGGGVCPPGAGAELPPEILTVIHRRHLSVSDPTVFHHRCGRRRSPDMPASWRHVAVLGPGAPPGLADMERVDLVVRVGGGARPAVTAPTIRIPDAECPDLPGALERGSLSLRRQRGFVWLGPVLGRSGYANAGRGLVASGREAGLEMSVVALDLPTAVESPVVVGDPVADPAFMVIHSLPVNVDGVPVWSTLGDIHRRAVVGATCFESTTLPPSWVTECGRVQEVWVPTAFNRRTFADAGVDPDLLHCIPYPVDTRRYAPGPAPSAPGPFTFLSVFEWTWRKGWDLLLDAYTAEFSADEAVQLRLLTYRGPGALGSGGVLEQAEAHLRALGRDPAEVADIDLILDPISTPQLIELYRGCGAFVLPSRGEGAGMPILESAACGAPVIATAWGGHEELMQPELTYPVEVDRFVAAPPEQLRDNPLYEGQLLAEPSLASLRAAMREAFEDPAGARRRAVRARGYVEEHFGIPAAGVAMRARVDALLGRSRGRVAVGRVA